jgi:hypothetical protein
MVMITDGSDGKCDACGKPHGGQYYRNLETREEICCGCQDRRWEEAKALVASVLPPVSPTT